MSSINKGITRRCLSGFASEIFKIFIVNFIMKKTANIILVILCNVFLKFKCLNAILYS